MSVSQFSMNSEAHIFCILEEVEAFTLPAPCHSFLARKMKRAKSSNITVTLINNTHLENQEFGLMFCSVDKKVGTKRKSVIDVNSLITP